MSNTSNRSPGQRVQPIEEAHAGRRMHTALAVARAQRTFLDLLSSHPDGEETDELRQHLQLAEVAAYRCATKYAFEAGLVDAQITNAEVCGE